MSGFGSVIGSMLVFFVIVIFFFGVFFTYQTQITEQVKTLERFEGNSINDKNFDLEILSPFYSSGRMNFLIENTGEKNILYKKNNVSCFDFYTNNKYINYENYFMNTLNPINKNYYSIERDNFGIASLKTSTNFSIINRYKMISCDGIEKEFLLEPEKENWWNNNWSQRNRITAKNQASDSIAEYQILVELNETNFDFTKYDSSELRFILPLKENFVLDLTFDDYQQNINDFSKYSNTAYLGNTANAEASDPANTNGIILKGLQFDGNSNYIKILPDSSLKLNKTLTYSVWIKWNEEGDNFQNIFTNGNTSNTLKVINDGGINNSKILFQLSIDETIHKIYSDITIDNNWHFITATYDGADMRLFIDGTGVGSKEIFGKEINTSLENNYIGYDGSTSFFNGSIDEIKILDIALSSEEILDLYYNNLRYRELDYYIAHWDISNKIAEIYVKIPFIGINNNVTIDMYFDNKDISSTSDIENTFAYLGARPVGYVVSERIASNTGLNIMSLYDNNTILIDDNSFNLNEQEGDTLSTANIDSNDKIMMRYLAQIQANAPGGDMIVPISWAGKEFYYSGMGNNPDIFCMIAPWGNAIVNISEAGNSPTWEGTITANGDCIDTLNIDISKTTVIISDLPILVYYYGDTADDTFPMHPATKKDLYGNPTGTLYIGTGPDGNDITYYQSDGTSSTDLNSAYGADSEIAPDEDGDANSYRVVGNFLKNVIQQNDGDGDESTIFGSITDMGIKFGAYDAAGYIVTSSPYFDANCSVYNQGSGTPLDTIVTGTGSNGIYAYKFDVGDNTQYTNDLWKIECEKPVWPQYENDIEEGNLFGHMQMRQYIYPEPIVIIN